MSVGKICTREVYLAEAEESAVAAAKRMSRHNVGTLVVLNEISEPVGIITDRDLALGVVATDRPNSVAVREIMSRLPDTVTEDTAIETALSVMRTGQHRRLPVVDSIGKLVGIVSLDDILELLVEEFKSIGELLEH